MNVSPLANQEAFLLPAIVNFICQLDTPGKKGLRDHFHRLGLWPCLWGISLTDVGRPSPLGVVPSLGRQVWTV